jgi:hypothetical protein
LNINAAIDIPLWIEIFSKARSWAVDLLNNVHKELYQPCTSEEHRKFLLLKVQAAIIQFELCSGFLNLVMTPENCFARKVILKSIIHIVFEYRITLKNHHIKTLLDLCDSKSFNSEKENLAKIIKEYRKAIKQIDKFQELRIKATGHYDPDIATQVSLIESINENESIETIKIFISFNNHILESLSKIGRKK